VRFLTDEIQLDIAKRIVRPEDFCNPAAYDTVMREAFSGTFFVVDITGVWGEHGLLIPMIIEAQTSAALPDHHAYCAYELAHLELVARSEQIKAHLR
jgi:hypothetical protein